MNNLCKNKGYIEGNRNLPNGSLKHFLTDVSNAVKTNLLFIFAINCLIEILVSDFINLTAHNSRDLRKDRQFVTLNCQDEFGPYVWSQNKLISVWIELVALNM